VLGKSCKRLQKNSVKMLTRINRNKRIQLKGKNEVGGSKNVGNTG